MTPKKKKKLMEIMVNKARDQFNKVPKEEREQFLKEFRERSKERPKLSAEQKKKLQDEMKKVNFDENLKILQEVLDENLNREEKEFVRPMLEEMLMQIKPGNDIPKPEK